MTVNDPILTVRDIGKAYPAHESFLKRARSWFAGGDDVDGKWVLRHVSFDLQSGDAVGIVGQNGAGKSTLLKLLTGTSRPSEGVIGCSGRISAILELGMGFNPDFTGRQNAYHALGLMNHDSVDLNELVRNVEEFAEVEEYFDMPMRVYSSGMQMRVAFAVATAVRPEILIVDEALSVGDAYFQHKSFDRIRDFRKEGTTLLIVSHDKEAIQSLCNRAILLDHGRIVKDATPAEVMDYYNAMIAERENSTVEVTRLDDGRVQTSSGTGEASVTALALHNAMGDPVEMIGVGDDVELRIEFTANADIPTLVLGFMIKDRLGVPMYGTNTYHTGQALKEVKSGDAFKFVARFPMNLGIGTYSISTALVSTDTHLVNNYEWRDLALVFTVANLHHPLFVGNAFLAPQIHVSPK